MIRPPATAWLDNRWNQALDLAAEVPVSPSKVAEAWERSGPDRTLAALRAMAVLGDEIAAREAG